MRAGGCPAAVTCRSPRPAPGSRSSTPPGGSAGPAGPRTRSSTAAPPSPPPPPCLSPSLPSPPCPGPEGRDGTGKGGGGAAAPLLPPRPRPLPSAGASRPPPPPPRRPRPPPPEPGCYWPARPPGPAHNAEVCRVPPAPGLGAQITDGGTSQWLRGRGGAKSDVAAPGVKGPRFSHAGHSFIGGAAPQPLWGRDGIGGTSPFALQAHSQRHRAPNKPSSLPEELRAAGHSPPKYRGAPTGAQPPK